METLSEQLKAVIQFMDDLPFTNQNDEVKYKVHHTGIKSLAFSVSEISEASKYVVSDYDKDEVHVYSSPNGHLAVLVENPSFWESDDDKMMQVYEWFSEEYKNCVALLNEIFGSPAYQNDNFVDYAMENLRLSDEYQQRRDVPLEMQLIGSSNNALAYWYTKNNKVFYLSTSHEDKELPICLNLGVRPVFEPSSSKSSLIGKIQSIFGRED